MKTLKLVPNSPSAVPASTPDVGPAPHGSTAPAKTNAYDTTPPPALLEFMMKEWKAPSKAPPPKVKGMAQFAARRRALSARFPGEMLVIPTGHEKVRANDTNYRFRPGSDFYYLTGNLEPDCALVMLPSPRAGTTTSSSWSPTRAADSTFYTDRMKGELWVGPRLGVPQSAVRFGVHQARGLPELTRTPRAT